MLHAPIPANERDRLSVMIEMGLLDNLEPEERFDYLTKKAVDELGVPISTLTIVSKDKEHYKSCQGLDEREGERSISFCGHAIYQSELLIVPDCTKDPRFADNPMVIGKPFIRFYAGVPLYEYKSGMPVAVFCIKDIRPRQLSTEEIDTFLSIAEMTEREINKISK
jgi:GAF domain-containing protein